MPQLMVQDGEKLGRRKAMAGKSVVFVDYLFDTFLLSFLSFLLTDTLAYFKAC